VRDGAARDRNLANSDDRPLPDPCIVPKALLVVERTNDVTHPDIAVPLQTFLAPRLPKA
jgi:hypothetical protein